MVQELDVRHPWSGEILDHEQPFGVVRAAFFDVSVLEGDTNASTLDGLVVLIDELYANERQLFGYDVLRHVVGSSVGELIQLGQRVFDVLPKDEGSGPDGELQIAKYPLPNEVVSLIVEQ